MRNLASTTDVLAEHVYAGLVTGPPESSTAPGPLPRIHSSRCASDRASLAVQHRGWWFYLDDADVASKQIFLQIQILFLTRLSQATRGTQTTPLLTIPVK